MDKFKGIKTLYEDESCLVIDKPADMMSHPDLHESGETVSDWMRETYTESAEIDADRPGIVHRLDRDTSGCMLLIKNKKHFNKYKAQFQDHTIKKVYIAIVAGIVRNDTGIIDTPIARAKSDFRRKEVKNEFTKDYRGELRDAITRYKVIERIKCGGGYTVLECLPLTGRTHQIRVHLRSIRHPIVGDELYGSQQSMTMASRQMLHAKSLDFVTTPDQKVHVESPMPEDMKEVLEKIKKLC